MGGWSYAYYFPGTGSSLVLARAPTVLLQAGFTFDESLIQAVTQGPSGSLVFAGPEIKVAGGPAEHAERVSRGEQFLTECRSRHLFLACAFAPTYWNPFLSLGWSRRLFSKWRPAGASASP